jgi:sortase (surface protein transpeptidase)
MRVFVKTVLVAIVVCAVALFLHTFITAFIYNPGGDIEIPNTYIPPTSQTMSKPVRLIIPSLNIDAEVQAVGQTANKAMGVPTNYTDVGWYKYGPVPGQIGSAVIDGHVDNGLALPGVFKQLHALRQGDEVFVITENHETLRFIVTEVARYAYTDAPTDRIFGQTDRARLNVITCSGRWIKKAETYDERIVVYTILSPKPTEKPETLHEFELE